MADALTGGAVAAAEAALDRLAPPGGLGVAVSGGGDSTALLLIAARWAAARGREIAAVTVDHGLRPESAAEAAAVAALCAGLSIPHDTLVAGDLRARGGNLPAAAREARIALIGGWARRRGLAAVALGHTLDDQAETVLMRLARGSGAEGLAAMEPARRLGGTLWLRPLLELGRAALREYLGAKGVAWAEDPTNEAPEFDRVKARRALAALAPLGIAAEGLADTARRLQRQRRVLERAMRTLAARARRWGALGEAWLDQPAMATDEADTALRLLADTLVRVAGAVYRPRFRALAGLMDEFMSGRDFAATLAGCQLRRRAGGPVLVCREPAACAGPEPLGPGLTLWDGRWRIAVRGGWPDGAIAGMLGAEGVAEVERRAGEGVALLSDVWTAAPREVRLTVPAIRDGGVLLAVPAAGFVNPAALGRGSAVAAVNIAAEELNTEPRAAYGPPAARDPAS